jgi:hypothetical protein
VKAARQPLRKFQQKEQTVTLSDAKTYLGRLVGKALKGETVYILAGQERFLLQHVPSIPPIPLRPPNYFADCYTREEIAIENKLAKASSLSPPDDLE